MIQHMSLIKKHHQMLEMLAISNRRLLGNAAECSPRDVNGAQNREMMKTSF